MLVGAQWVLNAGLTLILGGARWHKQPTELLWVTLGDTADPVQGLSLQGVYPKPLSYYPPMPPP